MYETFFSLQGRPFSAAPNTKLYFPATAVEQARQTLTQSIDRGDGAAILIGPAGTGKSLLMHVLAQQHRNEFEVVLLTSARLCTRRALLQNILFELALPYRDMEEGELRLSMIDHLNPSNSSGMLLLIDEAHTLPSRLLEEVRMITNLVREGGPCVRLVLAGTRALEEQLAHPKLESLNQRVASRCYLESMSKDDTRNMIRRQIVAVGGDPDSIFTAGAIDAIHRAADGIPRLVNQVADHALLLASINGQTQITEAGVDEAWADIQQLPTPWNAQQPISPDSEESSIEFGSLDDEALDDEALDDGATFSEEVFQDPGADQSTPFEDQSEALPVIQSAADSPAISDDIDRPSENWFPDTIDDKHDRESPIPKPLNVVDHEETNLETDAIETQLDQSERDQIELRLAPISIHSAPQAARRPSDPAEVRHSEHFPFDDMVTINVAEDAPPAIDVSAQAVTQPNPTPAPFAPPEGSLNKLELTHDTFFAPVARQEAMEDPFAEAFDDEEVVIQSAPGDVPAVIVPKGPLSREFSQMLANGLGPQSEPEEILTWSTADPSAVLDPIVTITGLEAFDGSLGESIVLADDPQLGANSEDAEEGAGRQVDIGESESNLADQAEWEPSYGAISTHDDRVSISTDELDVDIELPADDVIDESIAAADDEELIVIDDEISISSPSAPHASRARASVKDYRQLFAQLRRG